ncbi:hypothetical protein COL922a_011009 [Colletotrichum nupharicola]|nr:hypothetical protein COL922a_011009 [Colletotrichum nupharicola]
MATDMKTDNEDPVKVDSQKKKYDTTNESRASFEGQTTEWPARPLPELLRDLTEDELKDLEKKLIRKVDMRMLPTMILIYIMNYLDRLVSSVSKHRPQTKRRIRNAIGSARLGGLEKDLGLTGSEFQTMPHFNANDT